MIDKTAGKAAAKTLWDMQAGVHLGALEFSRSIKHWVNDALITLFFFIVALELKRELVLGELRNPRMAPATPSWKLLAAGGLLTGIGFTMALFIGDLAFDPELLNSVKLAIFGASVVASASGLLALTWLTRVRE